MSLILSDSTTDADFRPIKLLNVYNYATYTGYTYIQVFRFLKHIMTSETFNDNKYMHFVCFKRTKPHVRSRADAQHCASARARPYGSNTTIGTWKADEADKIAWIGCHWYGKYLCGWRLARYRDIFKVAKQTKVRVRSVKYKLNYNLIESSSTIVSMVLN